MLPRPVSLALLAVMLAAPLAVSRPPLPAAKGHDLRGPALEQGLQLTVKTTISCKDLPLESGERKQKLSISRTEELEVVFVAIKGRQPTQLRTKVAKDEARQSYPDRPFPPELHVYRLAGHTVASRLEKGGWVNTLEKGEADIHMQFSLSLFSPWSPDDGLFPVRPVPVGATWDVDPKGLTYFFGAYMSPTPGGFTVKGKGKLRAVEKYQGQPCAVVDFDLALTGKEKNGRAWSATLKRTVSRSLKVGVNLKTVCDSEWQVSGGGKSHFKMSGKQKQQTVVTVKASGPRKDRD